MFNWTNLLLTPIQITQIHTKLRMIIVIEERRTSAPAHSPHTSTLHNILLGENVHNE